MGEKTIPNVLEEIASAVCDRYCKYPEQYEKEYGDEDEAYEKLWTERCAECPVCTLMT